MTFADFDLYIGVPFDAEQNLVGPDFIRVRVTPEWLDILERRGRAMRELGFSSGVILEEPDYVDEASSEESFSGWRLHVTGDTFGFIGATMTGASMSSDWTSVATLLRTAEELAQRGEAPMGLTQYAGGVTSGYAGAVFTATGVLNAEFINTVKERFPELDALDMHLQMSKRVAGSVSPAAVAAPRTRMRV